MQWVYNKTTMLVYKIYKIKYLLQVKKYSSLFGKALSAYSNYWKYFKISLVIISLFLLSCYLAWNFSIGTFLICATAVALYNLPFIYKNVILIYPYVDIYGFTLEIYVYLVELAIANSSHNGVGTAIFVIVLYAMMVIDVFTNKKAMSFQEIFDYLRKNKELIVIFITGIFFFNTLLFILGFGIVIDPSSLPLFIYTFLAKLTSIRLVITLIICFITKQFKQEHLSINILTVFLMVIFACFNFYYVIPYLIASSFLASLGVTYTNICDFVNKTDIKVSNHQGLVEGICNILTKYPIIGKKLEEFSKLYHTNISDRFPSFRRSYSNEFKTSTKIFPLNKISKFTPINIANIMPNKLEVTYHYKGSASFLNIFLKNKVLSFSNGISNFVSTHSNLVCKVHLICSDEIVTIDTSIKNGYLQPFSVDRIPIGLKNSYSYNHEDLYNKPSDRVKELLTWTDPSKIGSDLQVFMNKSYSFLNSNYQQERSIENVSNYNFLQDKDNLAEQSYSLDKGKERMLEPNELEYEDIQRSGEEYGLSKYDSVSAELVIIEREKCVKLGFDPDRLSDQNHDYLMEILTKGRGVIIDYIKNNGDTDERFVEDFPFTRILMPMESGQLILFKALYSKFKEIISPLGDPRSPSTFNNIKPFSLTYIGCDIYEQEGAIYNQEDAIYNQEDAIYNQEDAISNQESAIYNQEDAISNQEDAIYNQEDAISNRGGDISSNVVDHSTSNIRDDTELGQTGLNGFKPEKIKDLIFRLRTSQKDLYERNRAKGVNSWHCTLSEIGIKAINGIKQWGEENALSLEIADLRKVQPEFFSRHFSNTRVNPLCSKLHYLIRDNVTNDLTSDEIAILIDELESRMHKLFEHRRSQGHSLYKNCLFINIDIITSEGIVLDLKSASLENEITSLLDRLIISKPECFKLTNHKINFSDTLVKTLIFNLKQAYSIIEWV
jgi:hypothetical protein